MISVNDLITCRRSLEIWTYKTKWRNEEWKLAEIIEDIPGNTYFLYNSDNRSIVVREQNFNQYYCRSLEEKLNLDYLLLRSIQPILEKFNFPDVQISNRFFKFNGTSYKYVK